MSTVIKYWIEATVEPSTLNFLIIKFHENHQKRKARKNFDEMKQRGMEER